MKQIVTVHISALERYRSDLTHLTGALIRRNREQLDNSDLLLRRGMLGNLTRKKDYLTLLETRTSLVNPQNILKRGYSMTMKEGRVIKGTADIHPGDILETRLHKGKIISKVEQTLAKDDKRKN